MKNKPNSSIILPAYNAEKYIAKSISSILNQTYKNFELIIIDDGSTDNTLKEVNKFNDSRIKIIKNEENLGLPKTLNKAIYLSKGKYIARADADDEWIDKDKLKRQINFLEENPKYALVGTGAICVDKNGKYLYKYLKPKTNKKIKKTILGYNCFIHSSVVFKKSIAKEVGLYSEDDIDINVAQDYSLWLKLGVKWKLYNLPHHSIKYMVNQNSHGRKNIKKQIKTSIKLAQKYKKYYKKSATVNMVRNYLRLLIYGYIKPAIKKLIP